MVDVTLLCERRDHNRRHAGPRAPSVDRRGRDVIPEPAVFVVGEHDDGVLPVLAVLNGLHQRGDVILSASDVAVLGVTAVGSDGFDERDRGKRSVAQSGHEVPLVLEMLAPAVGPIGVRSEVREGLVVKNERGIGPPGNGVVPTT